MPTTTVIRPADTAPRVGDVYPFRNGERTFAGVVVAVTKVAKVPTHVHVAIELTEKEHRRLTLG